MANQPETPNFDEGVYQIETTDPVQGGAGGIDNKALLALSNRTRWLRQHVDALEEAITKKAPLASPEFAGTPRAPTQNPTVSGTEMVNAEWVRRLAKGWLYISLEGSNGFALTAEQASYSNIIFTGTPLNDAMWVVFPAGPGIWTVFNGCTKGVQIRNTNADGFYLPSGARDQFLITNTDGSQTPTQAKTNFIAPYLRGAATADTPARYDNSTRVPTTNFVMQAQSDVVRLDSYVTRGPTDGAFVYYTVPAWARKALVELIGAGAGGMNCVNAPGSSAYKSGGGGGAGARSVFMVAVAGGAQYGVLVGTRGGAQAGGGFSRFDYAGHWLVCGGGSSGGYSSDGLSGAGGSGGLISVSDANPWTRISDDPGAYGSDGQSGAFIFPGNGAPGPYGGAGRAGSRGGTSAMGYGAGGGGAYDSNGESATYVGGYGGDGRVIVQFFP